MNKKSCGTWVVFSVAAYAAVSGLVFGGLSSALAASRELIRNGNFEGSGLAGWRATASNGGADGTFVKSPVGSATLLSTRPTAANSQGGTSYAVCDQSNPSYQIIAQKFRIPRKARRVILAYEMFAQSFAPVVANPAGFSLAAANQQARVDLLKGNFALEHVGVGVIQRLYTKGADAVSPVTGTPYKRYRFDITRKAKPGRLYQIRFGVAVTANNLNLGLDNVSVKSR